jgi:hypothetical protein
MRTPVLLAPRTQGRGANNRQPARLNFFAVPHQRGLRALSPGQFLFQQFFVGVGLNDLIVQAIER